MNDDAEDGTIAPNLLDTMTGTIDSFRDGYGAIIDEAWSAELMKGDIVANAFTGDTTGGGSYTGLFYGDSADVEMVTPAPSSLAGTFDAHFANGHVGGAFGANKN